MNLIQVSHEFKNARASDFHVVRQCPLVVDLSNRQRTALRQAQGQRLGSLPDYIHPEDKVSALHRTSNRLTALVYNA